MFAYVDSLTAKQNGSPFFVEFGSCYWALKNEKRVNNTSFLIARSNCLYSVYTPFVHDK